MSELPPIYIVEADCKIVGHFGGAAVVYECNEEAIGCSMDFYPEFDEGYYIVDSEYREVLDHTTDLLVAWGFAAGYDCGSNRSKTVPLFERKHTPVL